MILFPAIDLKDGRAVRLQQGDMARATVYGDDPAAHPQAGSLDHAGWHHGFLFSQALTIGGGTWAVQRNIVAERVLGLPHDVDVAAGLTWAEAQRLR